MYILFIKKYLSNKIILITMLLSFLLIGLDPIITQWIPYGNKNNAFTVWVLQNTTIGARFYYSLRYIFPMAFTGIIFQMDCSSSLQILKLSRAGKTKYYTANILIPFIYVFLWFFLILSLNVLLSNLLFPSDFSLIDSWYFPQKGTFADYILKQHGIIFVELFYSFLTAGMQATLCLFCTLIQMGLKIKNIYIAILSPIVMEHLLIYLLDANENWMGFSIGLITQPAASYGIAHIITFPDCVIAFGIWWIFILILFILSFIRNKECV